MSINIVFCSDCVPLTVIAAGAGVRPAGQHTDAAGAVHVKPLYITVEDARLEGESPDDFLTRLQTTYLARMLEAELPGETYAPDGKRWLIGVDANGVLETKLVS